jgi:hypothetical protein
MLYARLTGWLSAPHVERRIAVIAFLFALPSLAVGLQADDYILREQVLEGGPFAAYLFSPRDPRAAHEQLLELRTAGHIPWWADEHQYPHTRFFRPLSSLSLWLDFAHGAPAWWMHLENCAVYGILVWLAIASYKQLGLSGAGLGWAAVFFGLDFAFATPVGWIAARNTLLAACFGLACILLHDRARRSGRPGLLIPACAFFALSLLSAEIGMCTLGYLAAHALAVDRAPRLRRMLALAPYAVMTGLYLTYYVSAGYGVHGGLIYRDVFGSPGAALLGLLESIPIWLATTATLPVASLLMFVPDVRLPVFVLSLVVLAILVRLLAARWDEQPHARMLAAGAVLSLLPLASALPQERLRFFVAFGVYGLLGPWVARDFDAPERFRRVMARSLWRLHGMWLPIFFIPGLFGSRSAFAGGGASALDHSVPRAAAPITVVLNTPSWYVPLFQASMRAYSGDPRPPVFALYAGSQALGVARPDARSLELYAARSWFTTPFGNLRDVSVAPFRIGARIELAHLTVEVREVDRAGAPTRARFTFDRSLDDPGLTFRYWDGSEVAQWTPPPVGSGLQLPAASTF